MSRLTSAQRAELQARFGERAVFDRATCRRAVPPRPGLLGPFLGRTAPDAIVHPESEAEVADLVRWAAANAVPLTPRGRATSPYGGAVPVRRGVVVDFARLSSVLGVDAAARTATVQAGIVWGALDRELARHDLTLRLYPTSYHVSTVGGWLAQGGAGIGSYEAGWFRDNVRRARVVLPDGMAWELRGEDVALVADAAGTTGLITELTLRVRPPQELDVLTIACPDAHALEHLIYLIVSERVPLWSVYFFSPRMAQLANDASTVQPELPAAHVAALVFRSVYRGTMAARLPGLLGPCQAEPTRDEVAQSLWERRFDVAGRTRAGPRRVPADVVVPLAALGDFLNAVQRGLSQPLAVQGVVVRAGGTGWPEVALHGFLPRASAGSALAQDIVAIAEEHGGRPYGTGLYFARHATKALGARRAKRLEAFKKQEDPEGLMNPGKLFGHRGVEAGLRLASAVAPLLRPFTRLFAPRDRKPPQGR